MYTGKKVFPMLQLLVHKPTTRCSPYTDSLLTITGGNFLVHCGHDSLLSR